MREAHFCIRHKGCWSSAIEREFPNVRAALVSWVTFPLITERGTGKWSALWKFEAKDEAELRGFLDFFVKLPMIEAAEVLQRERNVAIVHETSHAVGSTSSVIAGSKCHVVGTMRVAHGREYWDVVAQNARDIQDLFGKLGKFGPIEIIKIGRYQPARPPYQLTRKQLEALNLAVANGYYTWPRRISLAELAALVGLSRRTFQDHLRKAEAKLMPNLVQDLKEQAGTA